MPTVVGPANVAIADPMLDRLTAGQGELGAAIRGRFQLNWF